MTRRDKVLFQEMDTVDRAEALVDSGIPLGNVEESSLWHLKQFPDIVWTFDGVSDEVDCIDPAAILQSPAKPDVSFVQMIREAINESKRKRLYLSEIYESILSKYVYYRNDNHKYWKVKGLQSSLIHDLP